MPIATESRGTVFRRIAQLSYIEWPAYDPIPLYDHTLLTRLESNIRIVSGTRFTHHEHISVKQLVSELPLVYFQSETHDYYEGPTYYKMGTLLHVFILEELRGWEYETAFYEYLESHPVLYERFGLETVPDQPALWRSRHTHFINTLRDTVRKSVRTTLIKAQSANVAVPHEPKQIPLACDGDVDEVTPGDRAILSISQSLSTETSAY